MNDDRDTLYAERLRLWEELTAAGVDRASMADAAGVTAGMVKFALAAAKKKAPETEEGPRIASG